MHIYYSYSIFFPFFESVPWILDSHARGYLLKTDMKISTRHTHFRRHACDHTLSRPFLCPWAPHPSRVRLNVSSSPPAIAFRNMVILQRIRSSGPPSVLGRGAERLHSEKVMFAGTISRGPEGKYARAGAGYRSPGGACFSCLCGYSEQDVCEILDRQKREWAAGKHQITERKCRDRGGKKMPVRKIHTSKWSKHQF